MQKHGNLGYSLKNSHPKPKNHLIGVFKQFRLPLHKNRDVIFKLYQSIDTPVALSCYLMYKYHEYAQLVSKDINPHDYEDPYVFRLDFSAVSLLRKHSNLKTGIKCREVALEKFHAAELTCKKTNERLTNMYSLHNINNLCNEYILSGAIRKIAQILGDFSIDEFLDECRWGPGVTQTVKGDDTSASQKFDRECDLTKDAYLLYGDVLSLAYPTWKAFDSPSFKTGNDIITVPKNAKTDRTIAVEPGLNLWIQRGLGSVIRKRLRSAGYDLNSDSKNQRGAYIGSIDDSLATIDFSSASDTISVEVVRLLLPPLWFTLLDAARSKVYSLDGCKSYAHKFSTMGNGFTFELESLIFLALAISTCQKQNLPLTNISVFGDDLVFPSEATEEFSSVANFLGFSVNKEKSFWRGNFRESCGSYFFKGVDVKPFFIKKDFIYAKDVFRLANTIRYHSHRHNAYCGCDIRYRSVWSYLIHQLPESIRTIGPVGSGDSTIHGNISESKSHQRISDGHEGYIFHGFPEVAISIEKSSLGLLLSRLYSTSELSMKNAVPLRARTRTIFKKKLRVHLWYDLGYWV